MKIYTKAGDSGETRIYVHSSKRAQKDSDVIDCYGEIDELNSHLGLLASFDDAPVTQLRDIQVQLFQVGFAVSASSKLTDDDVLRLESFIDNLTETLPPQTHFILPGGISSAAQAHVCRSVCRRAERALVTLARQHDIVPAAMAYLNRLSDYLFVLARHLNFKAGESDIEI